MFQGVEEGHLPSKKVEAFLLGHPLLKYLWLLNCGKLTIYAYLYELSGISYLHTKMMRSIVVNYISFWLYQKMKLYK